MTTPRTVVSPPASSANLQTIWSAALHTGRSLDAIQHRGYHFLDLPSFWVRDSTDDLVAIGNPYDCLPYVVVGELSALFMALWASPISNQSKDQSCGSQSLSVVEGMESFMYNVELLIGCGCRLHILLCHFLTFGTPTNIFCDGCSRTTQDLHNSIAGLCRNDILHLVMCESNGVSTVLQGCLQAFHVAIDLQGHTGTRTVDRGNAQGERGCNHPPRENGSLPDASSATPAVVKMQILPSRDASCQHITLLKRIGVTRLYASRRGEN